MPLRERRGKLPSGEDPKPEALQRSTVSPRGAGTAVGANGAVQVARVTRCVLDREGPQGFLQARAQMGRGGLDQDGANGDAAVRHHAAVIAEEEVLVVAHEHLSSHPLLRQVPSRTQLLHPEAQGGEDLDPGAQAPPELQGLYKTLEDDRSFALGPSLDDGYDR